MADDTPTRDTVDRRVRLNGRRLHHRRAFTAVYALAAAGLGPWIVVLAIIQPQRGTAVNNDGLRIVLLVIVVVLSTVAVARPRTAALTGTAAATLALLSAWFYAVTNTTATATEKIVGVAGLVVVTVVAGWLALASHHHAEREGRLGLGLSRCLLVAAAGGVAFMLARPIGDVPSTAPVDHLKIAWVGLDIAELAALVLLTYALRRGMTWTTVVAAVTASLLTTDALINILPASGEDRLVALAMAFVELPLAISALCLAAILHRRGRLLDEHGPTASGRSRDAFQR